MLPTRGVIINNNTKNLVVEQCYCGIKGGSW